MSLDGARGRLEGRVLVVLVVIGLKIVVRNRDGQKHENIFPLVCDTVESTGYEFLSLIWNLLT